MGGFPVMLFTIPFYLMLLGAGALIYYFYKNVQSFEKTIYQKIEAIGGKVISVEKRSFFTGIGPFHMVARGQIVYRILYQKNGLEKEGWVRYSGIMGPDWRLDEN
jgi:hypothetical protein